MIDLEEEPFKKTELRKEYEAQVHKIQAFPPLPTLSSASKSSLRHLAGSPASSEPIRGRILPKPQQPQYQASRTTDPSRNPLALLPGLRSTGGRAAYAQALTGVRSMEIGSQKTPPKPDDAEFPSLYPEKKTVESPSSLPSARQEDEEDSFVIGGGSAAPVESPKKSTKKKWQSVMRIGL